MMLYKNVVIFALILLFSLACKNKSDSPNAKPNVSYIFSESCKDFQLGRFENIASNLINQKVIYDSLNQIYQNFTREQRNKCRQMSIYIDSFKTMDTFSIFYYHTSISTKRRQFKFLHGLENYTIEFVPLEWNIYHGL